MVIRNVGVTTQKTLSRCYIFESVIPSSAPLHVSFLLVDAVRMEVKQRRKARAMRLKSRLRRSPCHVEVRVCSSPM